MPTENEILAILSVGAVCAGALYYMNHTTQTAWQKTLMRMTKESAGHVDVRQLTIDEAYPERMYSPERSFERARRAFAEMRTWASQPPEMSDMFEFGIQITPDRRATFRMYPETTKWVNKSFKINGVVTHLNLDQKKKIKEIGLNAHVMWKIGMNL